MVEWSNKYNPMNSDKGLCFYEHYKKIVGWFEGKNELPPPIEASLDPANACNNKCYYCNSQRYLRENPTYLKRWGRDYMEDLLVNLSNWGVRAFCWGGGGEATLNLRLAEMTRMGVLLGMEACIVTNGVDLDDDLIDALLLCKWIGVSVDTCDSDIYKQVRGTKDCRIVWDNIFKIAERKKDTTLGVRTLVLPETIDTIVATCHLAQYAGADFFHVRPVDLERKDSNVEKLDLDMEKVKYVFDECRKLETKDFKVFTVTHKYDKNFHVKHDFEKCWASPLVTQICTDKKMYVCVDHRLEPRFEVKEWGSDEHRELLRGINPTKECSRCTWSEYNKQIEEVVLKDSMHLNFP
ncbi:hypothetical protein LCGC14_0821080 [marine sediment metagenome]|uniref:Radical SAM core domain-containing protein n=1 Tax=marine sediment metagenome TaxID=412755 RepID=A0A0F9SRA6_9ZZZZ